MDSKIRVIAIDGRCASGKTTFAKELGEYLGAGVIHMDDFFLPAELRTAERLFQPGGNVHYERFLKEVMPQLRKPQAFTYRGFDCSVMQLARTVEVAASPYRIVEGAYSQHPALADYADVRIFCDIDPEWQLKRISERNGEAALPAFQNRWIPMEERYFKEYGIRERSDYVVYPDRKGKYALYRDNISGK